MCPPLELVHLVEVDRDFLLRPDRGQCPGGVVDADGMRQLALEKALVSAGYLQTGQEATNVNEGLLALDAGLELVAADVDDQVLSLVLGINGDCNVEVLDGLVPFVGQRRLLGQLLCARLGVGLVLLLGGWRGRHGEWLGGVLQSFSVCEGERGRDTMTLLRRSIVRSRTDASASSTMRPASLTLPRSTLITDMLLGP